ncbi:MAG TPA: family 10 glycosylhydrolase [Longimicrobiaceae bacterium]|nr:family 10 glycosylhydrolase [Longimicrobiaceae bacterium]
MPKLLQTLSFAAALSVSACASASRSASFGAATPASPPPVQREFRGVWVASVANIDWPSRPGLSTAEQQDELVRLMDRAAEMRLNAIILQVRPAADALYASPYEPWSDYLTGQMGKAPEPFYDPLAFAVQEAHRRGLELHAWFNPYRAHHPSATGPIAATHVSRTRPDLVRAYGKALWLDPGEKDVQDLSVRVILDVVRRYDIDGVHIDDYFYPYPETDSAGNRIDFPDEQSWSKYVAGGGTLSRGDWRRHNVDVFVERLNRGIHGVKPWVKFGVSPFGVWRPGSPPQIAGFDAYDRIYADSRKWLREGWVDYWTPQLYWQISRGDLSYPVLLRWWSEQNVKRRHLWPGLFTSRTIDTTQTLWPASEIAAQVFVTRGQAGATGHVHFSMKAFLQPRDSLVERLSSDAYAEPALVPETPWLRGRAPGTPVARLWHDSVPNVIRVGVQFPRKRPAALWTIRARYGAAWVTEIVPGWATEHPLPSREGAVPDEVIVYGVDRTGRAGKPAHAEMRP